MYNTQDKRQRCGSEGHALCVRPYAPGHYLQSIPNCPSESLIAQPVARMYLHKSLLVFDSNIHLRLCTPERAPRVASPSLIYLLRYPRAFPACTASTRTAALSTPRIACSLTSPKDSRPTIECPENGIHLVHVLQCATAHPLSQLGSRRLHKLSGVLPAASPRTARQC